MPVPIAAIAGVIGTASGLLNRRGNILTGTGANRRRQYYQQLLSGQATPTRPSATVVTQQNSGGLNDILNIIQLLSGRSESQGQQGQSIYPLQSPIYHPYMNYGSYT